MYYDVIQVGNRWALRSISLVDPDMKPSELMYFDSAEDAAIECERRNYLPGMRKGRLKP